MTVHTFQVVPMQPAHYVEAMGTGFPWLNPEEMANTLRQSGPAFAAFVDDRLAAVAGVAMESPGVGNAWALLTDLGRRHPMFVHRVVVRGLRDIILDYHIIRITARCERRHYVARAWLHRLSKALKDLASKGFKKESIMRRAGPCGQSDFAVYALITDADAPRRRPALWFTPERWA